MNNTLSLIERTKELFIVDIKSHDKELEEIVTNPSFLVIGGLESIGQTVTKEIFKRNHKKLHLVDILNNSKICCNFIRLSQWIN